MELVHTSAAMSAVFDDPNLVSSVAGMVVGAESIDDMRLLRNGGVDRVFTRAYAPSTLGSFSRAFTFAHLRQLDAVVATLTVTFAAATTAPEAWTWRSTPGTPVWVCQRDPASGTRLVEGQTFFGGLLHAARHVRASTALAQSGRAREEQGGRELPHRERQQRGAFG